MKRIICFLIVFFFTLGCVLAQDTIAVDTLDKGKTIVNPNIVLPQRAIKSIVDTVVDTLQKTEKYSSIGVSKTKKSDVEKKVKQPKELFYPDPNKAVWYGLICPGLGQIYNRRYWKLPIVYGGFVALGYGIGWYGREYTNYKRYYKDISDTNPNTKSYEELYSQYDKSIVTQDRLKNAMDNARRSRDLCIIGTVAFYAVTVLDAFVDASLANFDISPDLSMKVAPTVISTNNNTQNLAVRVNLNF